MTSVYLEEPKHPPIFILSCERSGSTLLRYILDTHSKICSPGELVLGKLCNDLQLVINRTLGQIAQKSAPPANEFVERREIRQIVNGIMASYAKAKGKVIWCDKSPENLFYLDDLEHVFPEARYICLYRNCLDVVYSCLEVSRLGFMPEISGYVRNNPNNLVAALIDSWVEKTGIILNMANRNASRCFSVRYETLISKPHDTLQPLFHFLGVDWESDLLSRVLNEHHDEGGGDFKINYTSTLQHDSIGRGKRIPFWTIPPERLSKMNQLLNALGYTEIGPDLNDNPPRYKTGESWQQISDVADYFTLHLPKKIKRNSLSVQQATGSIKYVITGDGPQVWIVDLTEKDPQIIEGDGVSHCTLTMDRSVLMRIANNKSTLIEELLQKELKIEGDAKLAHIAQLIS